MKTRRRFQTPLVAGSLMILAVAQPGFSQEFTVDKDTAAHNQPDYSPFVDRHYPTHVLWGDTHLHTAN